MKKIIYVLLVILFVTFISSGPARAVDAATLYAKIQVVLREIEQIKQQNQMIIQNQKRIEEEIKALQQVYQSQGGSAAAGKQQ